MPIITNSINASITYKDIIVFGKWTGNETSQRSALEMEELEN